MKTIMFLALVSLSLVAATGCKKKGGAGEALAKLNETADKVCAAKDLATATKAQEDYAAWSAEWTKKNPGVADKNTKMSESDTKAFTDASARLGECYLKLSAGAAGSAAAAPAAGSAEAPPAAGSADGSAAPAGSADGSAAGSDAAK